jgi:hypothetical protein
VNWYIDIWRVDGSREGQDGQRAMEDGWYKAQTASLEVGMEEQRQKEGVLCFVVNLSLLTLSTIPESLVLVRT